jgi:hypothetical protein
MNIPLWGVEIFGDADNISYKSVVRCNQITASVSTPNKVKIFSIVVSFCLVYLISRFQAVTGGSWGLSPDPNRRSRHPSGRGRTSLVAFVLSVLFLLCCLYVDVGAVSVAVAGAAVAAPNKTDKEIPWNLLIKSHSPDFQGKSPSNVRLTFEQGKELPHSGVEFNNGETYGAKWKNLVLNWDNYIREKEDAYLGIGPKNNNDSSERFYIQSSHSFQPWYQRRNYAQLMAFERGAREMFGENLTAVMITLTASSRSPEDPSKWGCPLPMLEDLKEGYSAAYSRLYNVFGDREKYAMVRIIEPHKSGYPHMHIGLLTAEDVDAEDFQGVINSHLKNCARADESAHTLISQKEQDRKRLKKQQLESEGRLNSLTDAEKSELQTMGCVSVVKPSSPGEGSLGAYIGSYIGKELNMATSETNDADDSADDSNPFLNTEQYMKRFYSLMWISNTRRFQPSRTAREIIDNELTEEDEENDEEDDEGDDVEYELKGVMKGSPDDWDPENPEKSSSEWIPMDNPGNHGGRDMFTVDYESNRFPRIAHTVEPPSVDMLEWLHDWENNPCVRAEDFRHHNLDVPDEMPEGDRRNN